MSRLSDLFIQKLMDYNGKPVVINDWCHYITFDVMGDIAFGKSYGQLEAGRLHQGVALIGKWLSLAVLILQVPWLLSVMQELPMEGPEETLRKFSAAALKQREGVSAAFHKNSRMRMLIIIPFARRKSQSIQTLCRISSPSKVRRPGGRSTREL